MANKIEEVVIDSYDLDSIGIENNNSQTSGSWLEKRKDRKQKYRHDIFWRSCMVHHLQLLMLFITGVIIVIFTDNPDIRLVGSSLVSLVSGVILKDSKNDSFRILGPDGNEEND